MLRNRIAVIGLGGFGLELVKCLHIEKHEVVAIDINMELIDVIKDHCTNAICLDATDENAMKSQGLEDFDFVILAIADNFETLIISADILKRLGVKQIIARYQTELHVRILKMLGITNVFNPEERAAQNMAEMFSHSSIKGTIILSEKYRISEVIVPKTFIGKSIFDIKLRELYNLNLITIKRLRFSPLDRLKGDESHYEILGTPTNQIFFRANDIMVLFGDHDDVEKLLEIV